jgi:branched-chain amino acid aminotransferase
MRDYEPQLIAYAVPYVWILDPEEQRRGGSVIIASRPRIPSASIDARFKNHHWGDLTQGELEAQSRSADTAILCDTEGRVTEGPGFNVFLVKDGQLYTPRDNVLEGITRKTVLELAGELGVKVEVGDCPVEALRQADEVFLTSTAGGIMPITRVDGRLLVEDKPGPMSSRLLDLYWSKRKAGWHGTSVRELADG